MADNNNTDEKLKLIEYLPHELLGHIFSFINDFKELLRVSRTCHSWQDLARRQCTEKILRIGQTRNNYKKSSLCGSHLIFKHPPLFHSHDDFIWCLKLLHLLSNIPSLHLEVGYYEKYVSKNKDYLLWPVLCLTNLVALAIDEPPSFVEKNQCNSLAKLTNLQSLSLKICNADRENDLPALPPSLTNLSLSGPFYGKCLRRLSTARNIRRLELHNMNDGLRSVVDKLPKLLEYPIATRLQELVLIDRIPLKEDVVQQFAEFRRFSQLTHLRVTASCTKVFEIWMTMTNIQHLALENYPEYQYHPTLHALTRLTQLRRLTLQHELKNASDIFTYSMPSLNHLCINGYYIREDNFPAQMNLVGLTRLDIIDNQLTGQPLTLLTTRANLIVNLLPRHGTYDDE